MFSSTPTNLFFIGRDRLMRADFVGSKLIALSQRRRPESDDPVVLVGALVAAGAAKLGKVFVISTDCWTHTIELASATSRGMADDELTKMLAFEAEPLSGISAFDAAGAMQMVGDDGVDRRFWFTAVPSHVRDQFDEEIRRSGGRLAGMCHPGGVPLPVIGSAGSWRRVEFWPGAVVRSAWQGHRLAKLRIDVAQSSGRAIEEILHAWRKDTGEVEHEEVLLPDGIGDLSVPADWQPISLLNDAELNDWVDCWRRALAGRSPRVPLVTAVPLPMSKRQRMAISAALAACALVACWGHHEFVTRRLAAMEAEKSLLEAPGKELAELKKQTTAVETEATKQREAATKFAGDVQHCEAVLVAQRRRIADLLHHLSKQPAEGWVLHKIDGETRDVKLHGFTMHPGMVSSLATELSAELAGLGWSVDPPLQKSQNYDPSGGPWKFELRLQDKTATNLAKVSAAPKGNPPSPPAPLSPPPSGDRVTQSSPPAAPRAALPVSAREVR